MTSFHGRLPAKALASTFLPCLAWALTMLILGACQPQLRSDDEGEGTAGNARADLVVLEISKARYQPSGGTTPKEAEAAACATWSMDPRQAEAFFSLSTQLPEGGLHDFYWLPCSIEGRLQAEGREWTFEINAAGTSTWHSEGESRLLGCSAKACEPFVILMPESAR